MLRQYAELKQQVPDALLMFRMGDFYEMFFEDAELAASVLGLTLTARDKLDDSSIPMAGVPHHAVRGYVRRLIDAGHKVALADQVEDPRMARGIVKRAITEVVTPGLVTEPENLDARVANYLAAFTAPGGGDIGLAYIDISTGEFACTELADVAALAAELDRLDPSELLYCEGLADSEELAPLRSALQTRWAPLPDEAFAADAAELEIKELLGVADLRGFGLQPRSPGVCAAGAVLYYLQASQVHALGHVRRLRPYQLDSFMVLDETTRRNLELFRTIADGRRKGSLIGLLDRAATTMGSRRLRLWISAPLLDPEAIDQRLQAVQILVASPELRSAVSERLRLVHDIERLNGKVISGRANARDIMALRNSLQQVPAIDILLDRQDTRALAVFESLPDLSALCADISSCLVEEPPTSLKDGGIIARGFHPELDELIELSREGKGSLARLESEERKRTGISSLKVRYNRVFGYFIEVTRANLAAVPEHYVRKQTLANCERYLTAELKEFEAKVLGAEERRCSLEFELFQQLRARISDQAGPLAELACRLSSIDAVYSLADVAVRNNYVRPTVDDGLTLRLAESRHPVIEQMNLGERFVANDVLLEPQTSQLLVISGPNMAGKSTIMRQVALITLMAQAGSFVPARAAHIGVVDRIFTRVGASDNIARGQSTFMVEMSETAAILHHATERSLAILDEIGRGTSTYDGLSIAWSVVEHIADVLHCRTLFATHYHELSELAQTREHVQNFNISVSELGGRVIFLRRLRPGGTSRSYGIQVARLAGLPEPVLVRARELLANLEADSRDAMDEPRLARHKGDGDLHAGQLALFGDRGALLRDELLSLELDRLSPLEALNVLADLQDKARRS
jgi:DNA mismatch repair protein MutS